MQIRNTFVIFLVSGFWHGANWTFIVWGLLNAIYFLPLLLSNQNRINIDIVASNSFFPSFKELIGMATTFMLTVFAWIFFRATSLFDAFYFIKNIFTIDLLQLPIVRPTYLFFLLFFFIGVEWFGRKGDFALEYLFRSNHRVIRWGFYMILMVLLFLFNAKQETFIYFQF